jgi:hypothetical protein
MCGEPDFESIGCVSEKDCKILNVEQIERPFKQREECSCLGNKFELLSNKVPCSHNCIYCYWKNKK